MKRLLHTISIFFVLTSISCTSVSEITPIGKDTFMLASSSNTTLGGGNLRAKLLKRASIFCKERNKSLLLVDFSTADMAFGKTASAEICFRCLDEDDPEFIRPNIKHKESNQNSGGPGILLQLN